MVEQNEYNMYGQHITVIILEKMKNEKHRRQLAAGRAMPGPREAAQLKRRAEDNEEGQQKWRREF